MICASLWLAAAFCATCLLYHIRFVLSRGFWKVFWSFFKLLFKPLSNLRRKCPTIISHLFLFVKRFLKSFSKIFVIFSGSFAFRKATRLVYHISFHLSRGFSKVFQLFSIFVRGLSDRCPSLFRGALVQCSHIIALLPPIVKGFFSTFFTLDF